jgi:Uma2 family endonuclease
MNVAVRKRMTLRQFLDWEERQQRKYEFDGFRPVAMVGARAAHAAIQGNLIGALHARLRGKPCRAYGSDLKILVAGHIRYPDAFVLCRPIAANETVIDDPVVVFEILSEGTRHTDLVLKNQEYRDTPSILRYVILEQTAAGGVAYWRHGDAWCADILSGDEAVLRMPEIAVELPLSEIYEDVPLTEPGAAADEEPSAETA